MVKNAEDSRVYELAFDFAMELFWLTKKYPKEELDSLVSQIRRASRFIAAKIREAFAKRQFKDIFIAHLVDALGFCEETETWLDFSFECRYLERGKYGELCKKCDEMRIMLYQLVRNGRKP